MNNETNLPQSELLNNSDLEAEIQAYLHIESQLPPELRHSREQIEEIIKQKELAKTLTVALPLPEQDGQSDTKSLAIEADQVFKLVYLVSHNAPFCFMSYEPAHFLKNIAYRWHLSSERAGLVKRQERVGG